MKNLARHLFRDALAGVNVGAAMEKRLARCGSRLHVDGQSVDLRDFDEIVAVAFGKAAGAMAGAFSQILAPERFEGILVVPSAELTQPVGWRTFVGGHPVPNAASFEAGRTILERLARANEKTLIFFLISGGGSSLVEWPLDPAATLEDFQALHAALVTCGASIEEINTVRKRLSAVKGGRLAAAAPRATKITLAITDVPKSAETALASGPTLPDPTTIADAERVAREFDLARRLPRRLRSMVDSGAFVESPKPADAAFARSHFALLLGAQDLMHAAHRACESHGFRCVCDGATDDWPVEKAAEYLVGLLERERGGIDLAGSDRPVAVLCDGELRSPVTGNGVGGRNSAFVLACVPKIAGRRIAVLSAGTDGIDGNSRAAGAVADGDTLARAKAAGVDAEDFTRRSDAYSFFARLEDTVMTGPTGHNLRDLRILLAY
jgi:hydroxypyruvate reductase